MEVIDRKPKVSVCVVTYNQVQFVRQCLESVIQQKTDFAFEVIVSDDGSTDGTGAVIQELSDLYPELVVPVLNKKNEGAVANYFKAHSLARGQYIAHLDGDDYFLPGKLQMQADFLDAHPEHNLVWHRVSYLSPDGRLRDDLVDYEKIKGGYSRGDLIRYTFLANHSTKMYRSSQRQYCKHIDLTMDYFLNLEHLQHGKAAYVGNQILGVYRFGLGVSASPSLKFRHILLDRLLEMAGQSSEDACAINFAAFALLLADIRSRNATLRKSFALWVRTVTFKACLYYPSALRLRKMYAYPSSLKEE